MIETIYIEDHLQVHPRATRLLERFPGARVVPCENYTEVFNPAAQSFDLQKQNPALILAQKKGNLVLPAPNGFGISDGPNFYFSHMLNCLYDCRYCFLQGMFRSAHYVLFVNFEDFEAEIDNTISNRHEQTAYFLSGYDCDSLALESVTGFVEHFVPFFAKRPNAFLELRTKSIAIDGLLSMPPVPNVVVAFSFTPEETTVAVEHGCPGIRDRVNAAAELATAGWPIGIRLDPLLWYKDWRAGYESLIDKLVTAIPSGALHSASLGPLRFPSSMFQKIEQMYPRDELLNGPLIRRNKFVSYSESREAQLLSFVEQRLVNAFPEANLFSCDLGAT